MAAISSSSSAAIDELNSIKDELKSYKTVILESCHKELLQFRIRHTDFKEIIVKIQFPIDYPKSLLFIETSSKYISDNLLKGMVSVCEQELILGEPQIMRTFNFLNEFLLNNPFVVCSEEVAYIKKVLYRENDVMKFKPKSGIVSYKAIQNQYYVEFIITVPFDYPINHVSLEFKSSNVPNNLYRVIKGHSEEILRQCVQPPVRKKKNDPPFVAKPSLRTVMDFLVNNSIRKYPTEQCHICHETALPSDPKIIAISEDNPLYVYRMYCSHLYHNKCLEVYMKTPPFEGGKKCICCGQRLAHDKWNVPPKLAEERWAHEEAKKREIAEVAEFLGFD